MMRLATISTCALAAALLCACAATIPPGGCANADWRAVGAEDGKAGRKASFLDSRRKTCASVDAAAWDAGRLEGLRAYCTPANAYRLGARGRSVAPVCPPENAAELVSANQQGFLSYQRQQSISRTPDEFTGVGASIYSNRYYRGRDQFGR